MCCSSFKAGKRKFDGFSPYLNLSNQKIEESECQGDGCSVGDLGVSSPGSCVYVSTELNSCLCVMLLVLVFKSS